MPFLWQTICLNFLLRLFHQFLKPNDMSDIFRISSVADGWNFQYHHPASILAKVYGTSADECSKYTYVAKLTITI